MDINEADAILHFHTCSDNGTYFRLRLGKDPGVDAVNTLLTALSVVRCRYASQPSLPRGIAFSCGIILHFASECLENLKASGASQDTIDYVIKLKQAAFNALAGDYAT